MKFENKDIKEITLKIRFEGKKWHKNGEGTRTAPCILRNVLKKTRKVN